MVCPWAPSMVFVQNANCNDGILSERFRHLPRSYHKGLLDGGKNVAKCAQQRSYVMCPGQAWWDFVGIWTRSTLLSPKWLWRTCRSVKSTSRISDISDLGEKGYSVGCTTSHWSGHIVLHILLLYCYNHLGSKLISVSLKYLDNLDVFRYSYNPKLGIFLLNAWLL
jgi:hypothetical protein